MKFELKLQRRVIYFISNLTPEDKAQLVHSIEALRLDPYVDNITKFVLPYPPAVFNLYQDGRF